MQEKIYGPGSARMREQILHVKEKYIESLDLSEVDLKKKILDISGGDGNFAMTIGPNVVNLDFDAHNYHQVTDLAVTARAESMPFRDSSFELLVSTQALPFFYQFGLQSESEIQKQHDDSETEYHSLKWILDQQNSDVNQKLSNFLNECCRILVNKGEMRFYPVPVFSKFPNSIKFYEILQSVLTKMTEEGKIVYSFVENKKNSGEVDGFKLQNYLLKIVKIT